MHVLLQSMLPTLQQATTDPSLLQRLLDNHRQVSCGVTVPFSWVSVDKVLFVPSKSLFPQSYVSSGSSMVGLMVTFSKKAYAIPKARAPVPATDHCQPISPQEMLKHSSVCLCRVPGSWCAQGLFEPSEHLWHNWGLILNTNLPLLPSCWGFSFALGHGVSPHSSSSAYHLAGVSLTLDIGYLLMDAPEKCSHCS